MQNSVHMTTAEPPRIRTDSSVFHTEIETKILNTHFDQKILNRDPIIITCIGIIVFLQKGTLTASNSGTDHDWDHFFTYSTLLPEQEEYTT